jgi:two-component sensor histidine kinase
VYQNTSHDGRPVSQPETRIRRSQADLMARVFVPAHDQLVTKAEFNELTGVVQELAEAQRELAEAQKRTEWSVRDLAKQVGGLANSLGGSLEDV